METSDTRPCRHCTGDGSVSLLDWVDGEGHVKGARPCSACHGSGVIAVTDRGQLDGGLARIVQHCAAFGRIETPVRAFWVDEVVPYAQHAVSVSVTFTEPRQRRAAFTMTPDDLRYLTVEVGGRVVYDSRTDVPCDMATWEATARRFGDRPVVQIGQP
jgi:hypothetical protein